jgi:hypothetical protein
LEFRIALRDEQGFTRGYTIVRQYVAAARLRAREMFVPLSHRPGHAQADFGEADGYIGGRRPRQAADMLRVVQHSASRGNLFELG